MMDDMNNKTTRYITSIDFRTCDYDDSHHIVLKQDEPMTREEAIGYIRHWALELVTDLKINGKTTSWISLAHDRTSKTTNAMTK